MFGRHILALSLALATVLAASALMAHSAKQSTQPSDGTVLNAAPDTIGMTFDRPIGVTMIALTDQHGTNHPLARSDDMQPVSMFRAQMHGRGVGI